MTTSFQPFYIPPGEHIGAYVIRDAIGRGGGQMAYLADDPNGHPVVLKMSLSPKGREGSGDRLMHERFMSQVGNFINLRGTLGVAAVFAHDMFPDQSESAYAYLVQEWIPGSINVLDWYRDSPHELGKVLGGCITLAHACGEMMLRGICHRDLKPENILVTPEGLPLIVDFDSSKSIGARQLTAQAPGGWPGTKLYYSPEVCRAILQDPVSLYELSIEDLFAGDLHALGIIFYQVLTGQHPFDENAPPEKLFEQIAYEVPVRPRELNPEIPFGLEKVTMKLLQKEPEQRYPFGGYVVTDLEALLETDEDWERPFQTPARERREPAPSADAPLPHPGEATSVEPAPRRAPRRPRSLLVVAAIALASLVPALFFAQHGAAGPFLERGAMWVGHVKTAVWAVVTMALASCTGHTGKMRTGEDWLAECPAGKRKVAAELARIGYSGFDLDLCYGHVRPGPNAIDGLEASLWVRDGPVEVSAHMQTTSRAMEFRLSGVIKTDSEGARLQFDKMQLFNETEPEGAPPAGPIIEVCAYASEPSYADDLIRKSSDPPPASEFHPGFMFIPINVIQIHFAR